MNASRYTNGFQSPGFLGGIGLFMAIMFLPFRGLWAQDIQFSQFYANVLYLNPAFAGSAQVSRVVFHERLQWPSLNAKYITSSFSFDHNFAKYNSGLGFFVLKDWQGANTISSTEAALQYAYQIDLSPTFALRAGIEGKYVSRHIDYTYLTLPDQYTNNGFNSENSRESFANDRRSFVDLSSGLILYSQRFWAGIAGNHLNMPDQSFMTDKGASRLPLKLDLVTGYKFVIEEKVDKAHVWSGRDISITPTIHYKMQGKSDQLDLGLYGLYEHLVVGIWYRGMPLFKQYRAGLANNESSVFLIGYRFQNFITTYSYDVTVSKLHRAKTGGSHELNVTYVWDYPKKKRRMMKRLPCPDFF